jgi:hypothetical protein
MTTKTCNKCGDSKAVDEFVKTPKGTPAGTCKECRKTYYKEHYQKNPERKKKIIENTRSIIRENVRNMLEYLQTHPCVDCGEADPVVLEFDHVRGEKKASVSSLVYARNSWPVVQAEIAKCDVRCANCHRRQTAKRSGGWYKIVT